jgi:pescadillo protein
MGGRVEGKRKKKSKKVAVTSKFNGKRRLSRMGKKVKAGKMGPNTDFKTRSYVLKKLQISLKDFRRLCILKGIYPRIPSKPPKGADKIYYDIKDITYLSHEPLLAKFREFKTFMRKIRKSAGRNEVSEARRKDRLRPVMALDHLVKERYPRFVDALRDMDDALCMIHLFASLPSTGRVTAERTTTCATLCRHWQYYVAKSKSLRKVFVSVKGVYFQAEVMGESITWLAPHQFTQVVPREVDLRVMMTFLEFYEVFVKFALYKLYNLVGLKYPPVVDPTLHDAGCALLAIKVAPSADSTTVPVDRSLTESNAAEDLPLSKKAATPQEIASLKAKLASMQADSNNDDEDEEEDDDEDVPIAGPLSEAFAVIESADEDAFGENDEERKTFATVNEDDDSTKMRPKIFRGLTFFVNREVPLDWLQLCILSFGGKIGWDGPMSPFKATDETITHHVIDRPIQGNALLTREYIQPQWVLDSINAEFLLPVSDYRPGAKLPPHLSPFVNDNKEGYVPEYSQRIQSLRESAGIISGTKTDKPPKEALEDEDESENGDDSEYAQQVRAERQGKTDEDSEEGQTDDENEREENVTSKASKKANVKKGPKAVVYAPKNERMTEVS